MPDYLIPERCIMKKAIILSQAISTHSKWVLCSIRKGCVSSKLVVETTNELNGDTRKGVRFHPIVGNIFGRH